jgi:signal transduction histidine kinase
MRLAEFIERDIEGILREWEAFARTQLPAATGMNSEALRDHAREILQAGEQAGDKRENDGSLGLGLYIARQIAIAHGGEIAVRFDETATVFTVTLPRLTAKRAS